MKIHIPVILISIFSISATGAPKLTNCDYLLPPVGEVEDRLTHRPLAMGVAECDDEKGVERMVFVSCSREIWEDPNACANDESSPELKPLVKAQVPAEKPPEKEKKEVNN